MIRNLIIITLISNLVYSCSQPCDNSPDFCGDVVCTTIFAQIYIKVLFEDNRSADSVIIKTINKNDPNIIYELSYYYDQFFPNNSGVYTIFDDSFREVAFNKNLEIIVEGNRNDLSFEEEFVISSDCCHVFKVSGPDTVYLKPN